MSDNSPYCQIGEAIGALVESKQKQYGDSFGKSGQILRILYPEGIKPEALDDALTVTRIVDKLFRIATAQGGPDLGNETPWADIVGYGLLAIARKQKSLPETK